MINIKEGLKMEKVACCPNCKSVDIDYSSNEDGIVTCNNCGLEFATEEILTGIINSLNKTFNILSYISIITLILGSIDMAFFILMDYNIDISFIPATIISNDRIISLILTIGIILYSIFIITLFILFRYRKEIGKMRHLRKYVKKYGYKEVE